MLLVARISLADEMAMSDGRSILLSISLKSEVDGNIVNMRPKVITLEGKSARIKIGNDKAELNGKPVKTDKDGKESKNNFLTVIDLVPTIVKGTSPAVIKIDIKFSISHNGYDFSQSLTTSVIDDREPYMFEMKDEKRRQKLDLMISASIAQDRTEKPKAEVKVDTGQEKNK